MTITINPMEKFIKDNPTTRTGEIRFLNPGKPNQGFALFIDDTQDFIRDDCGVVHKWNELDSAIRFLHMRPEFKKHTWFITTPTGLVRRVNQEPPTKGNIKS